jgi:hypothetical protein
MRIDMTKLVLNRKGKVHGDAVTRGTGEHIPKEYKKKNLDRWKIDTKKYLD